jgi:S1-C subfamily serine protease
MKNVALLIFVSMLSSLITVGLFKFFDAPDKIIIREPVHVQRTSGTVADELFSGGRQRNFIASTPTDFVTAASHATPAVVFIRTLHANKKGYWNYKYTASSGSGVIVSPDGYVITNHHVVNDGSEIHLTLDDKREYEAELIGSDPSTDIALLKIAASELPFV